MRRFLPCLLYLAVIRSVLLRYRTLHRESGMEWSSERIEQLRALWHDGLSASQIATHLGGITRNAVIGKAHRLGLTGRPSPIKRDAGSGAAPARRKPTTARTDRPAARPAPMQTGLQPTVAAQPQSPLAAPAQPTA